MRPMFGVIVGVLALLAELSCVHNFDTVGYGLSHDSQSYIPARIAVLGCRPWPNGARVKKQPITNTEEGDLKVLCEAYDKYVLQGFAGQPYMRGISPAVVDKLVDRLTGRSPKPGKEAPESPEKPATDSEDPTKKSGLVTDSAKLPDEKPPAPRLTEAIEELWAHVPEDCSECSLAPSFYVTSIMNRPEWHQWLSTFSKATQNSDAVLVPFVTYVTATRLNDRGVLLARKQAGVALFLIDTNNGALLWSGGREVEAINRSMEQAGVTQERPFPKIDELTQRLFVEDLWQDFPGRQVY